MVSKAPTYPLCESVRGYLPLEGSGGLGPHKKCPHDNYPHDQTDSAFELPSGQRDESERKSAREMRKEKRKTGCQVKYGKGS